MHRHARRFHPFCLPLLGYLIGHGHSMHLSSLSAFPREPASSLLTSCPFGFMQFDTIDIGRAFIQLFMSHVYLLAFSPVAVRAESCFCALMCSSTLFSSFSHFLLDTIHRVNPLFVCRFFHSMVWSFLNVIDTWHCYPEEAFRFSC